MSEQDEFRPQGGFRAPGERAASGPDGSPQHGQGQPQYGAPQYGPPPGPGQYRPPPYGQPEYGPGAGAPRRGRVRAIWATVATATAVVLTAGGVYAYSTLSGSGAVLAEKVPGDAVAYAEVNLDPPAGQKIAVIRFLRRIPDAKTGGEDGSLLESVIEPLIDDPETRRLFVDNIRPWLGKHVAFVGDPQDGKVQPVVVAETTDPGRTRSGLDAINRQEQDDKDKVRYAIVGDLVYLAQEQAVADTAAKDSGSSPLASDDTFSGDVAKVGDGGIVTFWSDLAEAAKLDPSGDATGEGRVVGSLRFTDSTADLVVHTVDNPTRTGTEVLGDRVRRLPADTAAAVAVSGADDLVRTAYTQLEKVGLGRQLDRAGKDLGLRLPEDVAALVGSSTVLAMGGTEDDPQFGLVSRTDDPAAAKRAAETLRSKIDGSGDVTVHSTPDGTVLASSAAYADALTGNGTLGQQDGFTEALPDLDDATAVVYVDLRKAATLSGEELPRQAGSLRAFGITAHTSGAESTIHLRLTAG